MPLKPIFDKAPLTAMSCLPLCAGMARSESPRLKMLYQTACKELQPAALEGVFRLACIVTAHPEDEAVTLRIREVLSSQREDGSFDASPAESVAILRACWALYEYETRKPLLEHIARWCAWAAQNWECLMADDAIWANPAELMELLENLYRVTGKAALLSLCERLSEQAMQWSGVLNTFSSQRATSRTMSREELETCLAIEKGGREGYYTHFCRTHHAERLADGARACMARGWYSGSATELNAPCNGWERVQRYHGAVCGGLTSGEMLEGASPAMPVSAAAIGAWAEALCCAAAGPKSAWAWEAVERIALNALPACIREDGIVGFQYVNTVSAEVGESNCFRQEADHDARALIRLARGCAAIVSGAVMACENGLTVNLYLPGKYAVLVGDSLMIVTITQQNSAYSIQVHCKQESRALVQLRVPSWAKHAEITVNGMESDAGTDCRDGMLKIDRVWHDGDVITVTLEKSLRVLDGHHQGKYVMQGPVLMAMECKPGTPWAKSFVSCTVEEGKVIAAVDSVKDWKLRNGIPADIPVLPAASGDETERVVLVPYAQTAARIALFPGRKNA